MSGLYNYRWQQARRYYLTAHPLCAMCQALGKLTPATVVDHRVPHRGDVDVFWDEDNWQALCTHHHNAVKQSHEKRGGEIGYDDEGRPLDSKHSWNADRGEG